MPLRLLIGDGDATRRAGDDGDGQIVDLCKRQKLVLLADEVYQVNVYSPATRPFHSFKKVKHR